MMLPLKNDLVCVCVLESHIKCTDTAIFACRTPGTRQERRKTKEVKNPSLKRSVLRASLAPKISFLSISLTPISSVSSSSFFSGRSPLPLLLPNMPLHILRFPTFAPLGNWVLWEIRDVNGKPTHDF